MFALALVLVAVAAAPTGSTGLTQPELVVPAAAGSPAAAGPFVLSVPSPSPIPPHAITSMVPPPNRVERLLALGDEISIAFAFDGIYDARRPWLVSGCGVTGLGVALILGGYHLSFRWCVMATTAFDVAMIATFGWVQFLLFRPVLAATVVLRSATTRRLSWWLFPHVSPATPPSSSSRYL